MRTFRLWLTAFAVAAALASIGTAAATDGDYLAYVGTYTGTASKGIYAYRFQSETGKMTPIGLAVETPHPSFLAVHPNHRFLYAVNEHDAMDAPGKPNSISAFEIDTATGRLRFLNKVSSLGTGPCHISIDKTGRTLLVANYDSGSVAALAIGPDGRLGASTAFDQHTGSSVDPARQTGPHAHFIAPSPDNRFALSADLGLDRVLVYRFDGATGTLAPNTPPFATVRPGSGPRHLAFHPNGKHVYVNSEMASTVSAFRYDGRQGSLTELQTLSTRPAGASGSNSTAEIQIDRTGRFLYVSNRGDNTIALFSIEPATGRLTAVAHTPTEGRTPRYFTLDPSGNTRWPPTRIRAILSNIMLTSGRAGSRRWPT